MAKRISELDIATSVSDSDFIPCVQGGVTKRATRAALYPDDVPVDTTSRIFDLTGDRVPPIPDDPAGVTYLQDEWDTTDGWTGTNATLSVSSGSLVATYTSGGTFNAYRTISVSAKLVIIRVKASRANTPMNIVSGGTIYKSFTVGQEWKYISAYVSGSHNSIVINCTSAVTGDITYIDWVYVGTGANLSKTIDRAGVPWTNFGALPVDGPFGKGLRFEGKAYLQAPGPMIGTTGTIALKFRNDNITQTARIADNTDSSSFNGFRLVQGGGSLTLVIAGSAAINAIQITSGLTIADHTLVFSLTGTTLKWSFDDSAVATISLAITPTQSVTPLTLGRVAVSASSFFTGTIYAFRADSRVWTDEEIARWSRDPYSEDSGLIDAFSLNFANLPTFADNAAAIAGNLPVGKLYKTSTGNVLVRY